MQQTPPWPTRTELRDRIVCLINEIAGIEPDKITEDAKVDEELQMSSVAFVELQVAIEEEYQIQVDPIQLVELNRFGAIVDYVHSCISSDNR